mmetsp:Transcript_23996/g.53143  ORF Transcript_23996/g.53143 Transcript_23996/m.53143 type:complete len:533 (-) Transcript_23996:31-1629(-)
MPNMWDRDLVAGMGDFQYRKLNMLQVGLGTFGTFLQNLTNPEEEYAPMRWLLSAASNASCTLLGVGVEPIVEHIESLRPALQQLPNAALLQAAIGRQSDKVTVHAITPECYQKYLQEVAPVDRLAFEASMLYFRNMSCVGRDHPELIYWQESLASRFGPVVEMQPVESMSFTYSDVCNMLRFSGVEVLVVDAEGHDCQILQSMVDHCKCKGNESAWPHVIQFESMGHSDKVDGWPAEDSILELLQSYGYLVVCRGVDTQLILDREFSCEARLQRWASEISCFRCGVWGRAGMPYWSSSEGGATCYSCICISRSLGPWAFEWQQLSNSWSLSSLASDGYSLWAVSRNRDIYCCTNGRWEEFLASEAEILSSCCGLQAIRPRQREGVTLLASDAMCHLAASVDYLPLWGADSCGRIRSYSSGPGLWEGLPGTLEQVSASSAAHMWGVDGAHAVCYREGSQGSWVKVSGSLQQVAVSGDGRHVWGVNDYNEVYYRAGHEGNWAQVPGKLTRVAVSHDGSRIWGLDIWGHPWECRL